MTSKTTWLLLVTAVAVFAAIVFIERPLREARNRKPDPKVFPGLDAKRVSGIQLSPANQFDIRVEKTNDTWRLIKPIQSEADAPKIEKLLQTLADLRWLEHITAEELRNRPKAQEEFGLASPQFTVTFQQNDATRTLLIGSRSVVGTEVFAQVVGGDGLFVLDGSFLAALPQNANDWRDTAALPKNTLTATVIEIQSGAKTFRLELDPTNQLWRMTRPLDARANDTKIRQLLWRVASAKATQFISDDANADFDKFGLPNTTAQNPELALTFFNGTNLLAKLETGASATNAPGQVYARRANQNLVFLLSKEVVDPWRATAAEFRDRRLILFPAEKISAIDLRGEDKFTVQREGTNLWQVKNKNTFNADPEAVQDLLTVLSVLEVNFETDVVTDFGQFGLTNAVLECVVHGLLTNAIEHSEDLAMERIQFGFGTNESTNVFVHRNDEVRVYSIRRRDFELLPRASWQLRDRRIWNFDVTNVVSVTIRQHGQVRKVLRTGPNEWRIAPGSQGVVDPFSIEEAVHRLGAVKALFWTARGEQNRKKLGFDETNHRVEIEVKRDSGTETLAIEFGGFSEFRHPYALVDVGGEKLVFEFPLPLYLEFVRRDLCILPPPLPFK